MGEKGEGGGANALRRVPFLACSLRRWSRVWLTPLFGRELAPTRLLERTRRAGLSLGSLMSLTSGAGATCGSRVSSTIFSCFILSRKSLE